MSDKLSNKTALVIIGGGPAGMGAALAAHAAGERDILILERGGALGGILQQCIHSGFGVHRFGEELTGPEYAHRDAARVAALHIPVRLNTMVTAIDPDKTVHAVNPTDGAFTVQANAVILAMGCRERPMGALGIAGDRPAGIFTAGTAQKYVNTKGCMPGREVVILGSGDIGLIMARRMTLEGATVKAVCELLPYSGGLARNIQQCLRDFDIPLLLSHTVTRVHRDRAGGRLSGVSITEVDADRRPIPGTEGEIPCDTLLLSCGLIPENELTQLAGIPLDSSTGGAAVDQDRMTAVPGIFACGNVLHVHDLVDYVSEEAAIAGRAAVAYLTAGADAAGSDRPAVEIRCEGGVRYTVPQRLSAAKDVTLYFRVDKVYRNAAVSVYDGDRLLASVKKVKMVPAEMERVSLKGEALKRLSGTTLVVKLEGRS
ncbi:MAG: FAD-dependent oxidoreductase [Eubacteriales bacterium]